MFINPLRLKILPTTKHCVKCSNTGKIGCHTVISGKNTYSEIQLVDQNTGNELKRLQGRKGYGVSTGVRFKYDHKRN